MYWLLQCNLAKATRDGIRQKWLPETGAHHRQVPSLYNKRSRTNSTMLKIIPIAPYVLQTTCINANSICKCTIFFNLQVLIGRLFFSLLQLIYHNEWPYPQCPLPNHSPTLWLEIEFRVVYNASKGRNRWVFIR